VPTFEPSGVLGSSQKYESCQERMDKRRVRVGQHILALPFPYERSGLRVYRLIASLRKICGRKRVCITKKVYILHLVQIVHMVHIGNAKIMYRRLPDTSHRRKDGLLNKSC
jgi:hypothetical protein